MPRVYANNAGTRVSAAATDVATTIDVIDASVFPAITGSEYYLLTLTDEKLAPTKIEIVRVTSVTTNTLTVVRAQGGTTAASWGIGDDIDLNSTASSFGGSPLVYTGAQIGSISTLADGANIATDLELNNFFSVTLAGNRTLDNPTNIVAGQSGSIFITQDATGTRTLAYGTHWDFAGGTAPVLSTAANAVDRLDYLVRTSTSIHAVLTKDWS